MEKKKIFDFSAPGFRYAARFLGDEECVRNGFQGTEVDLGLAPEEEEYRKANGEDNDEDDGNVSADDYGAR